MSWREQQEKAQLVALQHEGELELARLEAKRLAEEEARRAALKRRLV
jgi:hypothetical protein